MSEGDVGRRRRADAVGGVGGGVGWLCLRHPPSRIREIQCGCHSRRDAVGADDEGYHPGARSGAGRRPDSRGGSGSGEIVHGRATALAAAGFTYPHRAVPPARRRTLAGRHWPMPGQHRRRPGRRRRSRCRPGMHRRAGPLRRAQLALMTGTLPASERPTVIVGYCPPSAFTPLIRTPCRLSSRTPRAASRLDAVASPNRRGRVDRRQPPRPEHGRVPADHRLSGWWRRVRRISPVIFESGLLAASSAVGASAPLAAAP